MSILFRARVCMAVFRLVARRQDQFEEVVRKVSQGKEFSEKVADFMRKRQALEREYSKKLQALTKSADLEIGYVPITAQSIERWMDGSMDGSNEPTYHRLVTVAHRA